MATDNKEIKSLERAEALNATILSRPPIPPHAAAQTDLGQVLADNNATWNFSKDGGTGAMLVQTGVEATGGAAIKVEDPVNARQVQKCAQMMDSFFRNAQGEPPFAAPRVQTYSTADLLKNPQLSSELTDKLKDLKQNGPADIQTRVDKQIAKLADVAAGKGTVVKMEFASGKMMNQMSAGDRVGLYKSDAFAQNIGRSMPTFVAMGMNDHLGVEAYGFKNNAANLMFDTKSGQISAIDFSTQLSLNPVDTKDYDLVTFSQGGGDKTIEKLNAFLKDATKDQASFDQAVEMLANGNDTPFKGMMDSFTTADWDDNMFTKADAALVDAEISLDDKRRFAANLLSGTVDGLDYVKQNEQALRTAVLSTHEQVKGVTLEHFYTPEKLDSFCKAAQQVDTQSLRQNVDQYMGNLKLETTQKLAQYQEFAAEAQDSIKALDKKIDRMENKPSLRDRVKFLINGKDKVLGDLKADRVQLDKYSSDLIKDTQKLINQQEKYDAMKAQTKMTPAQLKEVAQGPQAPTVAPRVNVAQVLRDPGRANVAATLESRLRAPASTPVRSPAPTPTPAAAPARPAVLNPGTGSSSSSNAQPTVGDDFRGPKVAAKSDSLDNGPALDGDPKVNKPNKLSNSEEMTGIMKRLEDKLKPDTVSLPSPGKKVGG